MLVKNLGCVIDLCHGCGVLQLNVFLITKINFKYLLASWEMSFNFLAFGTVNTCISLGSMLTCK